MKSHLNDSYLFRTYNEYFKDFERQNILLTVLNRFEEFKVV